MKNKDKFIVTGDNDYVFRSCGFNSEINFNICITLTNVQFDELRESLIESLIEWNKDDFSSAELIETIRSVYDAEIDKFVLNQYINNKAKELSISGVKKHLLNVQKDLKKIINLDCSLDEKIKNIESKKSIVDSEIDDKFKEIEERTNILFEIIHNKKESINAFDISGDKKVLYKNNYNDSVVEIPSDVVVIKERAFENCDKVKTITLPNSITTIEKNAFVGCTSLKKVVYLGTIEQWFNVNFKNEASNPLSKGDVELYIHNELLERIKLYEKVNVKKISLLGFNFVKSIEIRNKESKIASNAFQECSSLESLTLFSIEHPLAMYFDSNNETYKNGTLKKINILNGEKIPDNAFTGFECLDSITLPSSITKIGEDAFLDCRGLNEVYYKGTIDQWASISFKNEMSNPLSNKQAILYINNRQQKNIILNGKEIKEFAFYNCTFLKTIFISKSVSSIASCALYGCSKAQITCEESKEIMDNRCDNNWVEKDSKITYEKKPFLALFKRNEAVISLVYLIFTGLMSLALFFPQWTLVPLLFNIILIPSIIHLDESLTEDAKDTVFNVCVNLIIYLTSLALIFCIWWFKEQTFLGLRNLIYLKNYKEISLEFYSNISNLMNVFLIIALSLTVISHLIGGIFSCKQRAFGINPFISFGGLLVFMTICNLLLTDKRIIDIYINVDKYYLFFIIMVSALLGLIAYDVIFIYLTIKGIDVINIEEDTLPFHIGTILEVIKAVFCVLIFILVATIALSPFVPGLYKFWYNALFFYFPSVSGVFVMLYPLIILVFLFILYRILRSLFDRDLDSIFLNSFVVNAFITLV